MSGPRGLARAAREGGGTAVALAGGSITPLRGGRAAAVLWAVEGVGEDARQEEMARMTGDDRRGGERQARRHPRDA